MKLNFCTLFNSSYLSRGIVMYESLQKHCADFHLYILAFDQDCLEYLRTLKHDDLTVISLEEFENPELLRVKPGRTAAEYCWTCSASAIHYCITTYGLGNCTYIDADMLFYSDPLALVEEMGDASVLITAHRYSPEYDQSAVSGKFCVQFVTFKNDGNGMKTLNWWKDSCIDWCYAKVEDGKFGDQKYLEEFGKRFKGIHELQHPGGGLAPWNIQQYRFRLDGKGITGTVINSGQTFKPVFFHFHGLKFFRDNIVSYTGELYRIEPQIRKIFYEPYLKLLNEAGDRIMKKAPQLNPHGNAGTSPHLPLNLMTKVRIYISGIRRSPRNIFGGYLRERLSHYHYFFNKWRSAEPMDISTKDAH